MGLEGEFPATQGAAITKAIRRVADKLPELPEDELPEGLEPCEGELLERRCAFPGCEARAFLQAHHIWHWEDGGPTDLDNLTLVCHFHHKLLHEFGWGVRLKGELTRWLRPGGRPYLPRPGPPPKGTTRSAEQPPRQPALIDAA